MEAVRAGSSHGTSIRWDGIGPNIWRYGKQTKAKKTEDVKSAVEARDAATKEEGSAEQNLCYD